mmetsp:Transcript_28064/g.74220  ORF Transcript_28064/g.74220 Transcript_28064/m.74220 type:complete len:427 (+) Transcript_28064:973-2253(+)
MLQVLNLHLSLLVALPQLLELCRHLVNLLLGRRILLLEVELLLHLLFEVLLHAHLIALRFLDLDLGAAQLLLLNHGLLHHLAAHKHLLFHRLQLLHHLGLRIRLLLALLPLLLQVSQKLLFGLVGHVLLLLDRLPFLLHLRLVFRTLLVDLHLHGLDLSLGDPPLDHFLDDDLPVHNLFDLHHFGLHKDLLLARLAGHAGNASSPTRAFVDPVRKLHFQPGDLVLKLADHRILGVLVDLGFVLDALRAVSVPQSAQGLVVVVVHRANASAHHRFGVAAQGILKQPRELGVAVRDERSLRVYERRDHVSQGAQGHVDLRGLLERVAARARLALPLGTGQVDHVHLAHPDVLLLVGPGLGSLDGDREDGVRSAGLVVHEGAGYATISLTEFHHLLQVRHALHNQVREVLHEDAAIRVILQLKFLLGVF